MPGPCLTASEFTSIHALSSFSSSGCGETNGSGFGAYPCSTRIALTCSPFIACFSTVGVSPVTIDACQVPAALQRRPSWDADCVCGRSWRGVFLIACSLAALMPSISRPSGKIPIQRFCLRATVRPTSSCDSCCSLPRLVTFVFRVRTNRASRRPCREM